MSCHCYQFGLLVEYRQGVGINNLDGTYEPIDWNDWSPIPFSASAIGDGSVPAFDIAGFASQAPDIAQLNRFALEVRLSLKHSKIPVKVLWDIYGDDVPEDASGLGNYDQSLITSDEDVTLTRGGTATHTISLSPTLGIERHVKNMRIRPCPRHI